MLCQYQLHGQIRRLQPRFGQSKQFGMTATMAASAAPTPWNHAPPLVNDFRWWDNIFLALPLPPTFNKLPDYHKGRFLIAPQHGGTHGALVSALESISSRLGVSSKKKIARQRNIKNLAHVPHTTLRSSPFLLPPSPTLSKKSSSPPIQ